VKAAIIPSPFDFAWKQKKKMLKSGLPRDKKNWFTVTAPEDFQSAFFLERSLVYSVKAARFDAYGFVAIR